MLFYLGSIVSAGEILSFTLCDDLTALAVFTAELMASATFFAKNGLDWAEVLSAESIPNNEPSYDC